MHSGCFQSCFSSSKVTQTDPIPLITRRKKCISIQINKDKLRTSNQSLTRSKIPGIELEITQKCKALSAFKDTNRPIDEMPMPFFNANKKMIQSQPNPQMKSPIPKTIFNYVQTRSKSNYQFPFQSQRFIPDDGQAQKWKRQSSLYGGARGIIRKLSRNEQVNIFSFQSDVCTEFELQTKQIHNFPNKCARSSQLSIEKERLKGTPKDFSQIFNQITLDNNMENVCKILKYGKLLGRGKFAHIYLVQEPYTGSVFCLKNIFKQKAKSAAHYSLMIKKIARISAIYHPNLISIYHFGEREENITIIQELSISTLYQDLKLASKLPLDVVRNYLKDIIQAVAVLHQHNIIHGNINPKEISITDNVCKLRPSFTMETFEKQINYREDIEEIAMVGYQMAYGLCMDGTTDRQARKVKITGILNQQVKNENKLGHFLLSLLDFKQNIQLSAGSCFNHPFFKVLD